MIGLAIATAVLWCPTPMILDLSKTEWAAEDQVVVNTAHDYCRRDEGSHDVQVHNAGVTGEWTCAMLIIKKNTREYRGLYTVVCSSFVGDKVNKENNK